MRSGGGTYIGRANERRMDDEQAKDARQGYGGGGGGGGLGATGLGGGYVSSGALPGNQSGEPEVTWIYERTIRKVVEGVTKESVNTLLVLFNKDGRVIQVQSFGYSGSGVTARGVSLGDPLDKIYKRYGWTASISRAGDSMTLDYYRPANVAFQLIDLGSGKGYKVVGITVAATDRGG